MESKPLGALSAETYSGRHLMVVFEQVDTVTVYPLTAYEVPRRYKR